MTKQSLLYASPFWPRKSGISEYSEVLIKGLAEFFDVSLFVDNYVVESESLKQYKVVNYKPGIDLSRYDHIIYNIGNNPDHHRYMYDSLMKNPGHIILHDYILYYLTVGYYSKSDLLFSKIYELEGIDGINIVKRSLRKNHDFNLLNHKDISVQLPLNHEIIEKAVSIFVHSEFSKEMLRTMHEYEQVTKIEFVKLDLDSVDETSRHSVRDRYKIPDDSFVFGSIGFIAATKQNEMIALAIKEYNRSHEDKIYYLMIGEGDYINHLLDRYIIKTGFLPKNRYNAAIERCNTIFNLRYPSNGETSATLVQCMGIGKLCIVTDIGWFHEVPDDCVIKLDHDITYKTLAECLRNYINDDHTSMCASAKEFIETQCDPRSIAKVIYNKLLNVRV